MNNKKHVCKSKDSCCGVCCTQIQNFSVTIGKAQILHNVNMHIHCGELTALIGPNGAGKSTLLKAILGEIKHTGSLKYLDAKGLRTGNPLIGYVPQYLNFDLGTPTSVLDLFAACMTKKPAWLTPTKKIRRRVRENLAKVNAEHLIDRRLGALSGGELQRVMLALSLDPVPDILLLDEPVSGIDQNGLELFYDTLKELKNRYDMSIILISHDFDLVYKYADRVVLLNNGTVVISGTPDEVFRDKRMQEVFRMSKFYVHDNDRWDKQQGGND